MDRLFAWAVAIAFLASPRLLAEPLLWGHLHAGPYAVGFSSRWIADDSRGFEAALPGGKHFGSARTPRPILLNEWYPATPAAGTHPMAQRDYLDIVPAGGDLRDLAEALRQSAVKIVASEVADADPDKLTEKDKAALNVYNGAATASYRDAKPAPGSFPLVVYVSGGGSTFEDNTVLCEYLASRGYIVVDSVYQNAFLQAIASFQTTGDDVQFLIHYGRSLPHADSARVALIGHSAGAQTVLAYRSREGAIADAVVSLDTTDDYRYTDDPLFKEFVDLVHAYYLDVPILFAANPDAMFQLADQLKRSHRYYVTERDTEHDEFVAHGLAKAIVLERPARESIDTKYTALCGHIADFLATTLHPAGVAPPHWPAVAALDFDKNVVNIEEVPEGATAPAAYVPGDTPPTPRQLRELILTAKYDDALAALHKFSKTEAQAPVYGEAEYTVEHLLAIGEPAVARRFRDAYKEVDPKLDIQAYLDRWGDRYARMGGKKQATRYYGFAVALDPDDKRAAEGLKKVGMPLPQ